LGQGAATRGTVNTLQLYDHQPAETISDIGICAGTFSQGAKFLFPNILPD
jgi:hypothetical protein